MGGRGTGTLIRMSYQASLASRLNSQSDKSIRIDGGARTQTNGWGSDDLTCFPSQHLIDQLMKHPSYQMPTRPLDFEQQSTHVILLGKVCCPNGIVEAILRM